MFVELTQADTGKKAFIKATLIRRVVEGKRTRVLFEDGFWRAGELEVAESAEDVVARVTAAASGSSA